MIMVCYVHRVIVYRVFVLNSEFNSSLIVYGSFVVMGSNKNLGIAYAGH